MNLTEGTPVARPALPGEATSSVRAWPTAHRTSNLLSPRGEVGPASVEDLVASIREHGLVQPLVVTPHGVALICATGLGWFGRDLLRDETSGHGVRRFTLADVQGWLNSCFNP